MAFGHSYINAEVEPYNLSS